MPAGATLPVTASAAPTAATVLAGDQKAGDNFAGMLFGASQQQAPNQQGTAVGATKAGNQKAPDVIEKGITTVQQDGKPDDMLAMLLTMVGSGSVLPSTDTSVATGAPQESADSKQPEPSMSQDVALYAAGAQIVLPTQINGRMPGADGIGHPVDDAVMAPPVVDTVTGAVPIQENTGSRTASTIAQNLSKNEVPVPDGLLADVGSPSQQVIRLAPLAEGGARMPLQQSQQAAVAQPEVKAAVVQPEVRVAVAQPEVKAVIAQQEVKTAQTSTATANTLETTPKPELPVLRDVKVVQTDASQVRANADVGKLTEVAVIGTPQPAQLSSDQPLVADTGRETAKLYTVTLPHEAASAGNQPHIASAPEKPAVLVESGLKAGVVQQVATTKQGLADGSDSGNSGEKFEEPLTKVAETSAGGTQQISGGHQVLFTQALGSATPQSVQATVTTPGPVSHEQVAGQVQEQLANHNLKPGNDQITFKLSPEHLGDIKVNLSLQDQRLRVEIVAENRVARDSLLQHVDSLKESLARQNISVEKFDVTTGGGSNTGSQGNNAQGEWRELVKNRQAQQWQSSGGYRTPLVDAVPLPPMYLAQTGHGMVDVHF